MNETQGAPVLVTGGAGYIGAHTAKALSACGYRPVVFDNLSSGHRSAVRWGEFVHGDIRDGRAVAEALRTTGAKAVIHFASLIEVGRSLERPDLFWHTNVAGTVNLLAAMRHSGVERLVFSSSAAVYGHGDGLGPLREGDPKDPSSPYGDTKLACERMIAAHARADGFVAVALRYFNAAGADDSCLIGEAHRPETHLIPLAIAAALGQRGPLTVFGDDFPTPDGSCLRDYVHVNDLASAHVAALEAEMPAGSFETINVGAGRGASVFEIIRAIEAATGGSLPFAVGPRRMGDPASLVADISSAAARLQWSPQSSSVTEIVESALKWASSPVFKALDV
jgi:UDP-glucose 4-epimerase/UDP-arabinose 4-epimerase